MTEEAGQSLGFFIGRKPFRLLRARPLAPKHFCRKTVGSTLPACRARRNLIWSRPYPVLAPVRTLGAALAQVVEQRIRNA